MGSDTWHTLVVMENNDVLKEAEQDFHRDAISKIALGEDYEFQSSIFEEWARWYDMDKDMRKYSKKYPKLIFQITCDEQDEYNFWRVYFKKGKMQECSSEVVYEPYDESKLK